MKIARIFPRRTNATPDDDLAFVGSPGLFPPEVDRVEISVAFTWDLQEADRLAREWRRIAPVRVGGPATGSPGGEFTPGRYLRKGYVITSRGCPNRCDFCHVWKREPVFRELKIKDGTIVQDDNLLACSTEHVDRVFEMLWRQPRAAEFRGLEARRLTDHHVDLLTKTRIESIFFAYDDADDFEPLIVAARKLRKAGILPTRKPWEDAFPSKKIRAYVLCGKGDDTIERAEHRMNRVLGLGMMPFAMLYMDDVGPRQKKAQGWSAFQKAWTRPGIIWTRLKNEEGC